MGKLKHFFQRPLAKCEMEVREDRLEKVCCVVQLGCVSDSVWMKCLVSVFYCLVTHGPFQSHPRPKMSMTKLQHGLIFNSPYLFSTMVVGHQTDGCLLAANAFASCQVPKVQIQEVVRHDASSAEGIYVDPGNFDEACKACNIENRLIMGLV